MTDAQTPGERPIHLAFGRGVPTLRPSSCTGCWKASISRWCDATIIGATPAPDGTMMGHADPIGRVVACHHHRYLRTCTSLNPRACWGKRCASCTGRAQARAGLGQRYLAARLYPGGKPDPPPRSWKEGMAVRRPVGGANASANLYSLIETTKAKAV